MSANHLFVLALAMLALGALMVDRGHAAYGGPLLAAGITAAGFGEHARRKARRSPR